MPDNQDAADRGMPSGLALAELLCTRLCHDFSGPLGVLVATADMLGEEGIDQAELRETLLQAADGMSRRLRFVRAAWGVGGAAITPSELVEMAEGVPGHGRVRLDVSALPPDAPLGPQLARTLMSAILLAGEALPRGGTLHLAADPAAGRVLLLPDGPGAAWPEGTAAALAGAPAAAPTARTLLAPLTAAIAHEAGLVLALALPPGDGPAMLAIGSAQAPAQKRN